ncbi:hypothetical protein IFM89_012521, partial [Coptis chinensis]
HSKKTMSSSTTTTNIMLSIHEKKTISLDLYRPLRNYITSHYSEREAQNLEDDLDTLKTYRTSIERFPNSSSDSLDIKRDTYQSYYRSLCVMESRFPISADNKDHITSICFTWYDAFKPKLKSVQSNISLEKSGVLFNLGSVYSQIGMGADRLNVNGLKLACNSFMSAAGVYVFLKENVSVKSNGTVDVGVECAGMLERLMLAQAQECFFEKVVSEGRMPGLCSKVARQVGLFYEEAFAALSATPLNQHFDQDLDISCTAKGGSLLCGSLLQGWGVAAQLVDDAASKLEVNLNQNLERATKENDRVYLMRVPAITQRLFPGITEMVGDIIKHTSREVATRAQRRCRGSADQWGPSGLEAELQQLRDLRRVNHELLVQTEELLEKEAREDTQFRSQFGTRWTRPQSSTLTKNLQDRLNRFAANLKQAAESDGRIERAVRDHAALMEILDRRPIESALPTLARPMMSLDANEDAIVGALKQSLRQLEILGAQRAGLEDMLKEMKRKDDILPKLMTFNGSYEDLFRKEIAKYNHICEEISENIEAQEHLLLQIQAQNDEFAAVFNLEDYKASREKSYKQIAASISKFREIKDNINEGLRFYVTLQDAITNIKQQCSDFVMTRNIQCKEMIEDVQRKMAGLNFQDGKSGGGYGGSYPSVGQSHPSQRNVSQQQPDAQNPPYPFHSQRPYYPPAEHQVAAGYSQPRPPYVAPPQPLPPYQVPSSSTYPGSSYPPHAQQQQNLNHEYGQPAYPGWRGPYYAHGQQPGSHPPPPYIVPDPYPPPHQNSGYYKHQ